MKRLLNHLLGASLVVFALPAHAQNVAINGNGVAMIYADRTQAGEIVISEKELALLRTLRNMAVLAIKQSI